MGSRARGCLRRVGVHTRSGYIPPARELVALSGPVATALWSAVDPDTARDQARQILDGSKYQERRLPRPFKGALEWLADRFRPVTDAVADVFGGVIDAILDLPDGRYILFALALGLVAALLWWLASRRARAAVPATDGHGLVNLQADPAELDREADEAEAAGDLALAVRRRYEAGLLRLVRAGRLVLRPDTTAASAALQVGDPAMDQLTRDFEAIVYGGRSAQAADVARARSVWVELLGARVRS